MSGLSEYLNKTGGNMSSGKISQVIGPVVDVEFAGGKSS
jgi:F-type H+-transporting ATPase subunit beta